MGDGALVLDAKKGLVTALHRSSLDQVYQVLLAPAMVESYGSSLLCSPIASDSIPSNAEQE